MKKIYSALSVLVLISFGFLAEAPERMKATANVVQTNTTIQPEFVSTASHVVKGSFTRTLREKPSNGAVCDVEKKDNYSNIVVPLAKKHGLDWRLVTAIMAAESSFNPCALSPKGAMG